MSIPTREEIKRQYNIANDDFKILTAMPPKEEVTGFITKIAEAVGFQTWMWKSWAGVVSAIILKPDTQTLRKSDTQSLASQMPGLWSGFC